MTQRFEVGAVRHLDFERTTIVIEIAITPSPNASSLPVRIGSRSSRPARVLHVEFTLGAATVSRLRRLR